MSRLRVIWVLLAALVSNQLRADNLYADRDSVKNAYDFLLYIPDSYYTSEKPLPLILNLHGKSLTGNDLNMITRYGCIDALRRGRKIDAVVLCPQCRTTGGWDPEKLMQVVEWVRYRFRTAGGPSSLPRPIRTRWRPLSGCAGATRARPSRSPSCRSGSSTAPATGSPRFPIRHPSWRNWPRWARPAGFTSPG